VPASSKPNPAVLLLPLARHRFLSQRRLSQRRRPLNEGFDGSTGRAIANLKDRLEEGRQIADKIGISALKEVQRQARVLQYLECRLKLEQASASKG
jgi:hypothetical protein